MIIWGKNMKIFTVNGVFWTILIIISLSFTTLAIPQKLSTIASLEDFDPLVDLEVTVEIQKIRSLEKFEYPHPYIEKIDWTSDPDFYVKVFINGEEFESNVWQDIKYIYDPQFSPTLNVPDDEEIVDIKIQLWDQNPSFDRLCDISGDTLKDDIDLTYSLKTGHWLGDDGISDARLLYRVFCIISPLCNPFRPKCGICIYLFIHNLSIILCQKRKTHF